MVSIRRMYSYRRSSILLVAPSFQNSQYIISYLEMTFYLERGKKVGKQCRTNMGIGH